MELQQEKSHDRLHDSIFSELTEQLTTTLSLVNYCEDLETTSSSLIDYLNRCKNIIYSYMKKDNSITLIAENTKQEIEKQMSLFYQSIEKLLDTKKLSEHATLRMRQVDATNQEIVEDFEKAISILENISTQTKILAMNSSIEAARIRDGAVFQIISKEVQKLSETTATATRDLSGSAQKIKEQSSEMDETLRHTHTTLEESVTNLLDGKTGFEMMFTQTETVVKESIVLDEILHILLDFIHKSLSMVEFNKVSYSNMKKTLLAQAEAIENMLEKVRELLPNKIDTANANGFYQIQKSFYEHFKKENKRECNRLIHHALDQGFKPEFILTQIVERSVEKIGAEQIDREVPLSEIYMNGKIIEEALEILLPLILEKEQQRFETIIIGNAFGDYHALGRRIVSTFLKLAGFEVVDLGNSVSNEKFVETVKKTRAKLVCVSALIIHTAKEVIDLRKQLDQQGLKNVKILVGGAPFNFEPRLAEEVGATGMARNAIEATRVVKEMLGIFNGEANRK